MGDYLTYFFNISQFSPLMLLNIFLISLFRLAPIVVIPPFFGGKLIPGSVKACMLIVLVFVFLPIIVKVSPNPLQLDFSFTLLAMKELVVGFLLAFLISIPFLVVQSSGILIDYLRGASIFQVQDPSMQNQVSPIGILYNYLLIFMFYQIDGPFLFFDVMEKLYVVLPPESFLPSEFFSMQGTLFKKLTAVLNIVASLSIQLAGPGLVSILMTEMFLGIANRLAPQVQISFLGMPLKSFVGIGVIWLGFYFIMQQFSTQTLDWIKSINTLINTALPIKLS